MYTMQDLPISPERTLFMVRWKIAGAFVRPNGSLNNCYRPRWQVNAISGIESGAIGTCQQPLFKSRVEKIVAPLS